jgi:hypothetical protein
VWRTSAPCQLETHAEQQARSSSMTGSRIRRGCVEPLWPYHRIWGTRRLDQQDVHFLASDGAMLNTLGHHKQLARLECDRLARRQGIPRMLNLRSAALREDRMACRCVHRRAGGEERLVGLPGPARLSLSGARGGVIEPAGAGEWHS